MGNTLQRGKKTSDKFEEQEDDGSSFTCEICIEPVSSTRKFKKNKKCYSHSYCLDCIAKHIEVKIEDYNMSEIKCPGLNCDEVLEPLTCRSILPVRVFEKWCDVLCESTLLQSQRAYCPYSDCSTLILNECRGKIRKTKCPQCKKWLCFMCQIPWHAGYKCDETVQLRDKNDFLLGQLMEEKKWKRCPTCNHGVELRSGCKSVKCRCGTRFCHACGKERPGEWCSCKRVLAYNLFLSFCLLLFWPFFVIFWIFLYFCS